MIAVTLARKPLAGTVAQNALTWGTGGLNIDDARINTGESTGRALVTKEGHQGSGGWKNTSAAGTGSVTDDWKKGRWPANLVLVHHPDCRQVGTKQVPGHKGYPNGPGGKSMHYGDQISRGQDVRPHAWAGHADEHGLETVPAWECVDGCPVAGLDQQSLGGGMHGAGNRQKPQHNVDHGYWVDGGWRTMDRNPDLYADSGGASRFFKQCQLKEPSP